ncbi:MAG: 4Fe-4S dicluster domain-containing protein [Dehalococcoidia bacterium]|nr:MAG: 4Fe-4S dicluster domain-containing protein [Dehalococcoidia bacterium]
MSKGVLYDATKCIGCRACQVACKQWNELPAETTINEGTYENPPRMSAYTFTKIHFSEIEDDGKFRWVFTKLQCMHCEHPGCVQACIVGALVKTEAGPVTYDDRKCIGCRYCQLACPFGIPNFEWDKPLPWIRKCTFCADRQGGGLEPACVTTCPTGALKFGERDELITEARRRIADQPGKYVDHIYGEKEVGSTSWLYLSPVPFEKLGFLTFDSKPVIIDAERAMAAVPPALLLVTAAMAGVYWLTQRRQRMSQAKAGDEEKEGAVKK